MLRLIFSLSVCVCFWTRECECMHVLMPLDTENGFVQTWKIRANTVRVVHTIRCSISAQPRYYLEKYQLIGIFGVRARTFEWTVKLDKLRMEMKWKTCKYVAEDRFLATLTDNFKCKQQTTRLLLALINSFFSLLFFAGKLNVCFLDLISEYNMFRLPDAVATVK